MKNELIRTIQSCNEQVITPQKVEEFNRLISQFPIHLVEKHLELILKKYEIENYAEPLQGGIRFALIGSIYASLEKTIDLQNPKHENFLSSIISEIQNNYKKIKDKLFDENLWRIESFDYGIKKIYYLDWQIYSSNHLY